MKIVTSLDFVKSVKHLDSFLRLKLEKIIKKVMANPEIGKPLQYYHGERSIRVTPFRLVYSYKAENNTLYLLKFDHRDSVYK